MSALANAGVSVSATPPHVKHTATPVIPAPPRHPPPPPNPPRRRGPTHVLPVIPAPTSVIPANAGILTSITRTTALTQIQRYSTEIKYGYSG